MRFLRSGIGYFRLKSMELFVLTELLQCIALMRVYYVASPAALLYFTLSNIFFLDAVVA